jgi:hypothetical protein
MWGHKLIVRSLPTGAGSASVIIAEKKAKETNMRAGYEQV